MRDVSGGMSQPEGEPTHANETRQPLTSHGPALMPPTRREPNARIIVRGVLAWAGAWRAGGYPSAREAASRWRLSAKAIGDAPSYVCARGLRGARAASRDQLRQGIQPRQDGLASLG